MASYFNFSQSFVGGVRVATGDYNGDGLADIIGGAGQGGNSHIRVVNPLNGQELASFMAFSGSSPGGIFVAGGQSGVFARPRSAEDTGSRSAETLSADDAEAIRAAAISRLASLGLNQAAIERLGQIEVQIDDLADGLLSQAQGNVIVVDMQANGAGWFVDDTALEDEEFALAIDGSLSAFDEAAAAGIDLLSVLARQMASLVESDLDADVFDFLADDLAAGTRRITAVEEVDAVFASEDGFDLM
jgi:hypothetical protein